MHNNYDAILVVMKNMNIYIYICMYTEFCVNISCDVVWIKNRAFYTNRNLIY